MPQQAQSATPMSTGSRVLLIVLGIVLFVAVMIFKGLVLLFGALFHHAPKYAFDVTGTWSARPSPKETIMLELSLDRDGKLHGIVWPCRAGGLFSVINPKLPIFTDRSSWNGQDLHLEAIDQSQAAQVDAGIRGSMLFGTYEWAESATQSTTHTVTFTRGGFAYCG